MLQSQVSMLFSAFQTALVEASTYSISFFCLPGALNCCLFLISREKDYLKLKTQFQKYAGYFHSACAARSLFVGITLRSFC